jgi:hypothetical protein
MQRRELLKLMTGLPVGAVVANVDVDADVDEFAFPSATDSTPSPNQLMYLHPGELTFVMGRPCNGKSTLALSIALDYAEAGKEVWYFSMARRSRETAELVGLELSQTGNVKDPYDRFARTRQFHSSLNGQRLGINFFDHYFATGTSLPQLLRIANNQELREPELVIYDADSIDCTELTGLEEHTMSEDLRKRRLECDQVFHAPIMLTLGMPGGADVERDDKRPLMEDLKPRRDPRPGRALVDELYFVHRPAIYDEDLGTDKLDALELTRMNRLRPDNHTRRLVRDTHSKRVRNLNHEEVELAMAHWDDERA